LRDISQAPYSYNKGMKFSKGRKPRLSLSKDGTTDLSHLTLTGAVVLENHLFLFCSWYY